MKISAAPLLPTGSFLNCRLGIERDIPESADKEEIIKELLNLWGIVIEAHKLKYPSLYNAEGLPLYEGYKGEENNQPIKIKEQISESIQATLDAINNSKDMDELKSYWLPSKSNLTLSQAYKIKEKEFTDA